MGVDAFEVERGGAHEEGRRFTHVGRRDPHPTHAGVDFQVHPVPTTETLGRGARCPGPLERTNGESQRVRQRVGHKAAKLAVANQADCIIALGGGSSLDSAKGIALVAANPTFSSAQFNYSITPEKPALPIIAIPTTSGTGSETNNWGVIDDPERHCKFYVGDTSTTPVAAILDPELTLGLPPRPTAGTGIDALTHAIESLTSKGSTPVSAAYAHQAIRLISKALPIAVNDGKNLDARGDMLLGAHLAGLALTLYGLGLVHGIAHSVSAHVGAAHGEA